MKIEWQIKAFTQLTTLEMFELLKLRQQVFVIEQDCVYPDIDDQDKTSLHILGSNEAGGLCAYLRILPPMTDGFVRIGRVVTSKVMRGQKIGKALMVQGIAHADKEFANHKIKISAQEHLQKFYAEFDFVTTSAPYDEDGIMHVEMVRDESGN